MSAPARLPTAARKASGDDENPRPKKLVGRQNSKGEIARAIAYKQMQIQDLNDDMTHLIAQFLTMGSSQSYHADSESAMGGVSKKNERSELDRLRLTSRSMNQELRPMKFELAYSEYAWNLRESNGLGMYTNALTWVRDLVVANRGTWMSNSLTGTIDRDGILDKFIKDPSQTLEIPVTTFGGGYWLRSAWRVLFGETAEEEEDQAKLFISTIKFGAFSTARDPNVRSFDHLGTLLDLMKAFLEGTWGYQWHTNPEITVALINVYGGVKVWTAAIWTLLTSEKNIQIINPVSGIWLAQYIDNFATIKTHDYDRQLREAETRAKQALDWPEASTIPVAIKKAFQMITWANVCIAGNIEIEMNGTPDSEEED